MISPYIVLEGLDGCGKSTLSNNLRQALEDQGHRVVQTREPGSHLVGFNVRDFVLSHQKVSPVALELLFQADRAEHTYKCEELIEEGYTVISDRSYISGLAYGLSCGVSFSLLESVMRYSIQSYPSHVIFIDVPIEVLEQRKSGDEKTREESKGRTFTERVLSQFKRVINNRILIPEITEVIELDGTMSEEELLEDVLRLF